MNIYQIDNQQNRQIVGETGAVFATNNELWN